MLEEIEATGYCYVDMQVPKAYRPASEYSKTNCNQ